MFQLPPVPAFNGLHPLIIHFPIALLLIAPIFVLIAALLPPPRGRAWHLAALVLMLLGTASVFVAVESGEAAGKLADRSPEINIVLERHATLAGRTSYTFGALTILFAVLLAMDWFWKRSGSRLTSTVLPLCFLMVYSLGTLLLVNTAHHGGRLVHELGVKSIVAGASSGALNPANAPQSGD